MSRRLSAQSCPQLHRRDLSKNPTACGPCGQPSLLTTNTVAALTGFIVWLTNTKFPTLSPWPRARHPHTPSGEHL